MPTDILPGYRFNTRASRYISNSTGRFVARRQITNLLDAQVRSGEERLANLTRAAYEGQISPSVFLEQMRTETRRQHLQNRALAVGGWDRLTQTDFGSIGGKLRAEYRRLEGFAADIANQNITLAQAINRASWYAGSASHNYWEASEERMTVPMGETLLARNILGVADHCDGPPNGCIYLSGLGWQLSRDIPPPKIDRKCGNGCKCNKIYKTVPTDEIEQWIGTKR